MEVRSIVVELDYHTHGVSILIHKYEDYRKLSTY